MSDESLTPERAWDLFDELAFAAVDAAKLAEDVLWGKANPPQD